MCICPEGYTQVGMSDDCRDVNECAANSHLCKNGHCVNTKGSFKCECYEGFEVSSDGKQCIGIHNSKPSYNVVSITVYFS